MKNGWFRISEKSTITVKHWPLSHSFTGHHFEVHTTSIYQFTSIWHCSSTFKPGYISQKSFKTAPISNVTDDSFSITRPYKPTDASSYHVITNAILDISIAPLQVHYYSEALPTTAWKCVGVNTPKRYRQLWAKGLPKVSTWRLGWDLNLWPSERKVLNLPLSNHAPQDQFTKTEAAYGG